MCVCALVLYVYGKLKTLELADLPELDLVGQIQRVEGAPEKGSLLITHCVHVIDTVVEIRLKQKSTKKSTNSMTQYHYIS